jgi:hypothetical protein
MQVPERIGLDINYDLYKVRAGSPVGPGAGDKAVVFSVAFLFGRAIVILPNPTSCFGPCAALVYCFPFRTYEAGNFQE